MAETNVARFVGKSKQMGVNLLNPNINFKLTCRVYYGVGDHFRSTRRHRQMERH